MRSVRLFLELVKVHGSPALQQDCSSERDVKSKFYENLWFFPLTSVINEDMQTYWSWRDTTADHKKQLSWSGSIWPC